MKKEGKRHNPKRWILIASTAAFLAAIGGASAFFYSYISDQLYQESIAQLTELSKQYFEKLEAQVDEQWDYLAKVQSDFEARGEMTIDEVKSSFSHYQSDLSVGGKSLYFRLIDSDGFYYTDEGRNMDWPGNGDLKDDKEKQSFLLSNWGGNQLYMAFTQKCGASLSVSGHAIEHFALLRPIEEVAPFFQSSAFAENNLIYIVDVDGRIIFSDGELKGIENEGINAFTYLEKQTFPHESLASLTEQSDQGSLICTDVEIAGRRFFMVYNPLPKYAWGVLFFVSSQDVAQNASKMVQSIVVAFVIGIAILLLAFLAGAFFLVRIEKDRALIQEKEKNSKVLQEMNVALTATKQKTEEALEIARYAAQAKSQFLANMSHDIRTPMNAIVGISKLMENEVNNPEKLTYYINKLRHSSQYMLGLINDILDMSKIESGDVHLNSAPVKMAEQVGQIESIIRSQSAEKDQEFTVVLHQIRHEYLIGDAVRIRQMFMNLLSNAVKYTPVGGNIRFELAEFPCEEEGHARILTSVVDDGCGMSEEFQKKMYEPFAREDNSMTSKTTGTGLGLSITKSVVDMMGGTIEVESAPGKGSRFDVWLTLPFDAEEPQIPYAEDVLLIAEEEMLIANIKTSLEGRVPSLRIAKSEKEAQSLLEEKAADAILLSGYLSKEILKKAVSALRKANGKPVFIFCCDYVYKDRVRDLLMESGIDGLIARPFFVENFILALVSAKEAGKKGEGSVHASLSGKRFLCAEDNDLNAEILEAILSMHGASCKIHPNGAEIVKDFETVKEGEYDAILMDVQMPVMNGMEATKAIRLGKNPLGKKIPIIAMTANAFSSDVEACLAAGMDAHLSKPLDLLSLERTLEDLLQKEKR